MPIGPVTGSRAPAHLTTALSTPQAPPGAFREALAASGGSADPQRALVDAILEKGLHAWAEERQREDLEARIRAQVLADMGLTEDDLSRMDGPRRTEIERRIQEILEQRMRAAMQEKLEQRLRQAAARSGLAL